MPIVRSRFYLLFFCMWMYALGLSAQSLQLKGKVVDAQSEELLPFATIYNYSNGIATITNTSGYFELPLVALADSVVISYVGYQNHTVIIDAALQTQSIALKAIAYQVNEVVIRPKEYAYLYELIANCKAQRNLEAQDGKAYYQLRSYVGGKQIELVDNYYNAALKGYDLSKLDLKAGRAGIRRFNKATFASLESSQPIYKHKLFQATDWFPVNPLALSNKRLRKVYKAQLSNSYVDEQGDSIYVVDLFPRKRGQKDLFVSTLWINESQKAFLKVALNGKNLKKFPLRPLDSRHLLQKKNLSMVKTFKSVDGKMYFDQIHFNYNFIYVRPADTSYRVDTKAVMQFYDAGERFEMPQPIAKDKWGDYKQLSAMPYNAFYWNNHDELRLHYETDSNALFIQHPKTISNRTYSYGKAYDEQLEYVFGFPPIRWSSERIIFEGGIPKQIDNFSREQGFQLKARLFMDVNEYADSIHVLTASLFDLYDSYYQYRMDTAANCMINMYFDLIEVGRRGFIEAINALGNEKTVPKIQELYEKHQAILEKTLEDFLEEASLGRNVQAMQTWNGVIRQTLKIDNLATFDLYNGQATTTSD